MIKGAVKRSVQRFNDRICNLDIGDYLRLIFLLNILDGILTLTWIKMRVADEANPLMAYLIDIDPTVFLFAKISSVTLSCFILWRLRSYSISKYITLFALSLYGGIVIYHFASAWINGIIEMPDSDVLLYMFDDLKEKTSSFLSSYL